MDRKSAEKYKRKVLLEMCNCAEKIQYYFIIDRPNLFGIAFDSECCPNAFKPGLSDKLIFMHIINEYFKKSEIRIDSFTGKRLMVLRYYPQYENWKKYSKAEIGRLRENIFKNI